MGARQTVMLSGIPQCAADHYISMEFGVPTTARRFIDQTSVGFCITSLPPQDRSKQHETDGLIAGGGLAVAPNWLSLHRRQTGNPGGGRSFLLAGGPSSFGCRNQSDQLEPYCSNASMLGIDRRVFWHSRTLEGYHMLSRMNSMKLRGSLNPPTTTAYDHSKACRRSISLRGSCQHA